MVCWHRRHKLGDRQIRTQEAYDALLEHINEPDVVALPLYIYDHGGITMNVTGFHSRWDSGQVGYIYVDFSTIRENWNRKRVTRKLRRQVQQLLIGEVKTYNQYITGDIYGFVIEDLVTCDKEHVHNEHVDSCWGFFGHDLKTNGMLDHFDENTRDLVLKAIEND
jgi:hypothetical protein